MASDKDRTDGAVKERVRVQKREPTEYMVVLLNDDYTTMDFVVHVLEAVFNLPEDQAIQIMLNVHVKGIGVAGVYTYEVAEMKVAKTTAMAREQEFPLLCTIENA